MRTAIATDDNTAEELAEYQNTLDGALGLEADIKSKLKEHHSQAATIIAQKLANAQIAQLQHRASESTQPRNKFEEHGSDLAESRETTSTPESMPLSDASIVYRPEEQPVDQSIKRPLPLTHTLMAVYSKFALQYMLIDANSSSLFADQRSSRG